jgi:tetratricopeptide (TPR) repeat protein
LALLAPPARADEAAWEGLMQSAAQARDTGEPAQALTHLLPALKEAEAFPSTDPRLTITLAALGETYEVLERFAEAEPLYRRAVGLTEAAAGADHPILGQILQRQAEVLRRLGRAAEAEPLAARAARIAALAAEIEKKDAAGPRYREMTVGQWTMALGSPQRMAALDVLQGGDPEALPVLLQLAKSEDSRVRVTAVGGLAELGAAAVSAVPALAEALKDKDLNVRYFAAGALKKIGPAAAPAVPALIVALSTHPATEPGLEGPPRYYKDARTVAAEALGAIGPPARAAAPRLRELAARDAEAEVKSAATAALLQIEAR